MRDEKRCHGRPRHARRAEVIERGGDCATANASASAGAKPGSRASAPAPALAKTSVTVWRHLEAPEARPDAVGKADLQRQHARQNTIQVLSAEVTGKAATVNHSSAALSAGAGWMTQASG